MALPSISRWEGRVALVTGASRGIGAAIAKSLVQHKMIVIGCARNTEKIENLTRECTELGFWGKLIPFKCDLSKETEIDAMFTWIEACHGGADICINNAGMSSGEPIIGCTVEKTREMLDTNVVALMLCASKSIESMLRRKVDDGHVFNINSLLGHFVKPLPASHAYGATKFAVTAVTEGIRQELLAKKSRIRVTAISPALVDTGFSSRRNESGESPSPIGVPALAAQDVADTVIFALSAPETVQIHDIQLRATGAI